MQFLNCKKVLCLSPHPDDVELSMAGTILKFTDTHFDILCLTSGSKGDTTSSKNRFDEVKDFWNGINNVNLIFSEINFSGDKTEEEWLNYIDSTLCNSDYDMILSPSEHDSHFEHILFYKVCLASIRDKSISFLTYNAISTLKNWIPDLIVDITKNYDEKWKRIKSSFSSQKNHLYLEEDGFNSFHSDFNSRKKGIKYSEHFCSEIIFT